MKHARSGKQIRAYSKPAANPSPTLTRAGFASYVIVTVLCIVLLVLVLQLWRADLRVPFEYYGNDAFSQSMLTKAVLDNLWYTHNRYLGAPWDQNLSDY